MGRWLTIACLLPACDKSNTPDLSNAHLGDADARPLELRLVGSYVAPGFSVSSLATSPDGRFLYAADANAGLHVLSLEEPTVPALVGSTADAPGGSACEPSWLADGRLVLCAAIYDLSVPTTPVRTDLYASHLDALSLDGEVGFKLGEELVDAPALGIYDIPEAGVPTRLGLFRWAADCFDHRGEALPYTECNPRGIALSADGTVAYLSRLAAGVSTVDISNPADMLEVQSSAFDNFGTAGVVGLSGGILYVGGKREARMSDAVPEDQTALYDLSNPRSPRSIVTLVGASSRSVHDAVLLVEQEIVLLSSGGLYAWDVSEANAPALLGAFYECDDKVPDLLAIELSKDNRYAYVAYGEAGVRITELAGLTSTHAGARTRRESGALSQESCRK